MTRFNFLSIESRVLPDLAIALAASPTQPRLGDTVTLTAKVDNRGKAAVTQVPVRFFDGPPKERGRLLAERRLNVAATSSAVVTIRWKATMGAHRLFAIVDPMNASGETNTADNVATLSLTMNDTTPPVARAGPDQMAMAGRNVIFDGRASTDDDRIVSYHWTVLPGPASRVRVTRDLDGAYVALPGGFPSTGTYTVRLTARDAAGNTGTDDLIVRVVDKFDTEPPVANAGRDLTVNVGEAVTFDGSASHDDYGIALATWDINLAADSDSDGDPGNDHDLSGLTPTLVRGYSRPGVYRVRLMLRDAVGNGPSTAEVTVRVVLSPVPVPIGGGATVN
ncbi:MAG TPA: PKD domain-containing protein [Thermoanaerobaculia bacterium]|nr:PKD domain-containing protein [Thermoanaerobaculia bacterium]